MGRGRAALSRFSWRLSLGAFGHKGLGRGTRSCHSKALAAWSTCCEITGQVWNHPVSGSNYTLKKGGHFCTSDWRSGNLSVSGFWSGRSDSSQQPTHEANQQPVQKSLISEAGGSGPQWSPQGVWDGV